MIYIKCPSEPNKSSLTTVFLAGGITNCPDWQAIVKEQLSDVNDQLSLIDPRRDDFDATNPLMSENQIRWEHASLRLADAILFWFPAETLCPITLFELGAHAGKVPIFVGTHPEYKRRFDVVAQLRLISNSMVIPNISPVRDNLTDVINDVRHYHNMRSAMNTISNQVDKEFEETKSRGIIKC